MCQNHAFAPPRITTRPEFPTLRRARVRVCVSFDPLQASVCPCRQQLLKSDFMSRARSVDYLRPFCLVGDRGRTHAKTFRFQASCSPSTESSMRLRWTRGSAHTHTHTQNGLGRRGASFTVAPRVSSAVSILGVFPEGPWHAGHSLPSRSILERNLG